MSKACLQSAVSSKAIHLFSFFLISLKMHLVFAYTNIIKLLWAGNLKITLKIIFMRLTDYVIGQTESDHYSDISDMAKCKERSLYPLAQSQHALCHLTRCSFWECMLTVPQTANVYPQTLTASKVAVWRLTQRRPDQVDDRKGWRVVVVGEWVVQETLKYALHGIRSVRFNID